MEKSFVISSVKLRNTNKDIEVYQNTVLSTQPLLIPKEPIIDEYSIYCKIEQHMNLSIDIHHLHKQTQCTISSLLKAKPLFAKGNNVYNYLKEITNPLNFASLINELDEALFNDCGCFDTFWVQDKEHKLESLYYKHDTCSNDISHQNIQPFQFNNNNSINLDEGMYLIMICDKWSKCLTIANDINENNMRLTLNVNRYEKKVDQCKNGIIDVMLESCIDDEQVEFIHQLKQRKH
jgi:hypothetical protein